MATMKLWPMWRRHRNSNEETMTDAKVTPRWQQWNHNRHKGDTTTVMTKLWQCDDEGNTVTVTMKPWQCDSEGDTMMWQQQRHGHNATTMMMDRWIGSTTVAHMFLFYKQWKFVFNSLYCNAKKKRIVYITIIVPHSRELGHYTALCDAMVAAA